MNRQEDADSFVTKKDLSNGIAIAQLFIDSLAQQDPYEMEDIFKLKRGEWNGKPLTRLGALFKNNVDKILQSYSQPQPKDTTIYYNLNSEMDTNGSVGKRKESNVPKIMSVLFNSSTSQTQIKYDSRFKEEMNTGTQPKRRRSISPIICNRNEHVLNSNELVHSYNITSKNDEYPVIQIVDDDDDEDYGYNRINDYNKRHASPFENRFSNNLEEQFVSIQRRSCSLSPDNLKGKAKYREPQNRTPPFESRLIDNVKDKFERKTTRNHLSPTESRLSDGFKDRSDYRTHKYHSQRRSRSRSYHRAPSRSKIFHQNRQAQSYSNSRYRSKSETRYQSSPKSRYQTRQIEFENTCADQLPSQYQHKSRNRSLSRSRYHRKSEDRDFRTRSSKRRSRSKVKTRRTSSHRSKKKVKSDAESKKSHHKKKDGGDQYSVSESSQHHQEAMHDGNAMVVPSMPVYRGPVPMFPPAPGMMYYPQPSMMPNRPPMRPPRMPLPGPYFMQPRPRFMGYTPHPRPPPY